MGNPSRHPSNTVIIKRTVERKAAPRHDKLTHTVRKHCYLCGISADERKLEKEHIFPKGLFAPNSIEQPIILSACTVCNRAKAHDEEYVMPHLAITSANDPQAEASQRKLWQSAKKRAKPLLLPDQKIMQPGAGVIAGIIKNIQDVELYTSSGIYEGRGGTINIDSQRFTNFYINIAKGIATSIETKILDWDTFTTRHKWDFFTYQQTDLAKHYLFAFQYATHRETWDTALTYAYLSMKRESGGLTILCAISLYNEHLALINFDQP